MTRVLTFAIPLMLLAWDPPVHKKGVWNPTPCARNVAPAQAQGSRHLFCAKRMVIGAAHALPSRRDRAWAAVRTDYSFSRLASQSRDCVLPSRSNSILPLMVSPLILPEYLVVNFCPFRSRVTVNETSPSLSLASSIVVSSLLRPMMAPVNLSPSF